MTGKCLIGDNRVVLPTLEAGSVQMCVTSPPYWGLRDYQVASQIGLESTPDAYVAQMVAVFREVKRVLRDDGVAWLNLGDSYAGSANAGGEATRTCKSKPNATDRNLPTKRGNGIKQKDLVGIPWMVAFALRADGWYLRQDIIWSKPNPMPESVQDRCTKSHEYIFMLSKSARYYYDADAIAEPLACTSVDRLSQGGLDAQAGSDRVPGKTNGSMKAVARDSWKGSTFDKGKTGYAMLERGGLKPYTGQATKDYAAGGAQNASDTKRRIVDGILAGDITTRNKRSVWTVTTKPFSGAHFATFPPDLIEPCILAGSRPGDTVLDPFGGSGTTGMVAESLGRNWLLIELNPAYEKLSRERTAQTGMQFA